MRRLTQILSRINYEDYTITATPGHGGVYVQGCYEEPDVYDDIPKWQYTRKWLISPSMTDSEIVQTVFKLCLTSMEHRCRENFTYRRARVFGPHFDVEDLVRLCRSRENAGGRRA